MTHDCGSKLGGGILYIPGLIILPWVYNELSLKIIKLDWPFESGP